MSQRVAQAPQIGRVQVPWQVKLEQDLAAVKPSPLGDIWTLMEDPDSLAKLPKDVQIEIERALDPDH